MSIVTRKASALDNEYLAQLYIIAGKGEHEYGFYEELNVPNLKNLMAKLINAPQNTYCSFRFANVVAINDAVVSTVSAFNSSVYGRLILTEALNHAGLDNNSISSFFKRLKVWEECSYSFEKNSWTIENVATHPDYRSRGYAHHLLKNALNLGREQGFNTAYVSTFLNYHPAINLYESLGFETVETKQSKRFENRYHYPGMVKMKVAL